MTLQYKFEHRLHPATQRYINIIRFEPPYTALFELDLLNTAEAAQNFSAQVAEIVSNNAAQRIGFEQILLDIRPNTSIVEYSHDKDIVKQEFPTSDLQQCLHDWAQFLAANP